MEIIYDLVFCTNIFPLIAIYITYCLLMAEFQVINAKLAPLRLKEIKSQGSVIDDLRQIDASCQGLSDKLYADKSELSEAFDQICTMLSHNINELIDSGKKLD